MIIISNILILAAHWTEQVFSAVCAGRQMCGSAVQTVRTNGRIFQLIMEQETKTLPEMIE